MNRDIFADIQPTRALVYVAGKALNFSSLRLEQALGEHHSFSITADFDALGQSFMSDPKEHLILIGQTVDIDLQQGDDNAKAYMFRGVIRNVAVEGKEGRHSYLLIDGASPTILMEKGRRYDVFTNLTLKQVVRQLTEDIVNQKDRLPVVNNPAYTGQTEFLMQYGESDWQFLRRLSCIARENMYWTGRDLVFGMHDDFPTLEVTYDREITSFQFGSRYLPNHFTRYQYLAEKDDTLTKDAPTGVKGADNYVHSAHEQAVILTERRPVRTPSELHVSDVGSLNELVEHEKSGRASQTVYIKGTSKTAHPRIGRLLRIKMPGTMKGAAELGTYRITKVVHEFRQNDRYECEFEGIPADLKYYPLLEVETPVAESIRGTVISNEDPDGQGRVRVDFPFASDRVSDAWLRVMTPHAGSSKEVERNRGIVFIPEKDDQVMVGFEFGDPNRPYVMGSMFHGKSGQGGGENNAIKSIIFRCGTKVIFNDDEGSAHIEVPSGSTFDMDGKGSIAVNAPKNMSVTVGENMDISVGKNISVSAGESIDVNAGRNISESAGKDIIQSASGNITETADNKTEIIEKNYQRVSEKSVTQAESVMVSSTEENMTLQSGKTVKINSAEKSNLF